MRILDRYILKSVIYTFISCVFIFLFIYVISDSLSRLDEILKHRIGISLILKYYAVSLPGMFSQTIPIAVLLSTIYTFGMLNRNNELIIIRSSGLNLWQICMPVIVIGIILSFLMLFLNEKIIPYSQTEAEKIKTRFEGNAHTAPKEEIINNLTFYGLENRLFFINSYDIKANIMKGITVLEHDRGQNLTSKITAKSGIYKDRLWVFYEFTRLNFDESGHISGDGYYNQEEFMAITETPQDFIQQKKRAELMNSTQLKDYIWRLRKSGAVNAVKSLLIDLYQRYSSAFTSLSLILIGIPFSFIIRKRANIFSSFGVCLGISFLYYVFTGISLAIGKAGYLLPFLSCWITPVSFCLFAFRLISKSR